MAAYHVNHTIGHSITEKQNYGDSIKDGVSGSREEYVEDRGFLGW